MIYISRRILFLRIIIFEVYVCSPIMLLLLKTVSEFLSEKPPRTRAFNKDRGETVPMSVT